MQAGHGSGVYIRVPSVVEDRVMETLRVTNPATGAADPGDPGRRRRRGRRRDGPCPRGPARLGRAAILGAGRASCAGSPGRCATTRRSSTPSCAESGKPRYEAENIELFYTLELTRYYTGRAGRRALADDLRHPFVFANKRARVVHHPRGVVAVIGPWNWPLLNNYADCIAPLAAGNAVVLKPSEHTPHDVAAGRRALAATRACPTACSRSSRAAATRAPR